MTAGREASRSAPDDDWISDHQAQAEREERATEGRKTTAARRGQRQDSLAEQMRDVLIRATEMGCYDAHDWIARRFYAESPPARKAT